MPAIRVLVVDDSVVVRRLVANALADDGELAVVGSAATGRLAVTKAAQVFPDVVVLDVAMPEMDGLETLRALRQTHPDMAVIMFSALTATGAAATIEALSQGAADYVTKPTAGGAEEALHQIRAQLIPKIKAVGRHRRESPAGVPDGASPLPSRFVAAPPTGLGQSINRRPASDRVDLVVIGASTGGPNAVTEILTALPANFPVPVLIVQHMPPVFTRHLAERLNTKSALSVSEGASGDRLRAGAAWVAPGGHHLVVNRDSHQAWLTLHLGPEENSCRPAVDVLFRSAVVAFGARVLAVVLTGMGQDGLNGCEAISAAGGQILAQDQASSVVWGMPGFVVRAGLADQVLPIGALADAILQRVQVGRGPAVGTPLTTRQVGAP